MPHFSYNSEEKLAECHPDIQRVFRVVIEFFDCIVLTAHRSKAAQDSLYRQRTPEGQRLTKVRWPNSKHNRSPSLAIDVAPYPVDWKDLHRFYFFSGFVMAIAASLGVNLRWGGDWDSDTEVDDQTFNDLVHFELVEENSSS